MEAGRGMTYSAEPRAMICGSVTEVDMKRGEECITKPQEMITDPQSGVPKFSKEDPVQHCLKRGDTLTEPGVLEGKRLRGNKKQVSHGMNIPFGGPLTRAKRSGDTLPEVCRHPDVNDVKLPQVEAPGLVR
jgi:hypothetical protein